MAKLKTYPMALTLSEDGEKFAAYCKDKHVRVFSYKTGKLALDIDESLEVYLEIQREEDTNA